MLSLERIPTRYPAIKKVSNLMNRTARARWTGTGKDGNGQLSTQSPALHQALYTFDSRFGEGSGTNPEELLAAAHAACFCMKLSFVIVEAGFVALYLDVEASVSLEWGNIAASHLRVKAKIDGITQATFEACVHEAQRDCPMCRVLNANLSVESILEN